MKKFYTILLVLVSLCGYSQRVSTFLDSPDADVDDALAFDSKGNLYGSNFAGTNVYKMTPSGEVSTFVSGLNNPNGLAFDSQDNLYVADYGGGAILKYDIDGNLLRTYDVGGFPSGLISAFDSDNVIFTTADFGNLQGNGVHELMPDGIVNTIYQGDPVNLPVGLAYGPRGELYIGDYIDREIYRIPAKGSGGLEYVATVPAPDNFVPFLAFIAYAQGYLYGTVYGENKIYKINPRNVDDVEIFAGSTFGDADGDVSEATFAFPAGIIANEGGNTFYISEFSGVGNIREISTSRIPKNRKEKLALRAYPNPASKFVNLEILSANSHTWNVKIYDRFGYEVYKSNEFDNSLKSISINNWKPGIYEVLISSGNVTESRRLIIK